jgi:hypothetical protein
VNVHEHCDDLVLSYSVLFSTAGAFDDLIVLCKHGATGVRVAIPICLPFALDERGSEIECIILHFDNEEGR